MHTTIAVTMVSPVDRAAYRTASGTQALAVVVAVDMPVELANRTGEGVFFFPVRGIPATCLVGVWVLTTSTHVHARLYTIPCGPAHQHAPNTHTHPSAPIRTCTQSPQLYQHAITRTHHPPSPTCNKSHPPLTRTNLQ